MHDQGQRPRSRTRSHRTLFSVYAVPPCHARSQSPAPGLSARPQPDSQPDLRRDDSLFAWTLYEARAGTVNTVLAHRRLAGGTAVGSGQVAQDFLPRSFDCYESCVAKRGKERETAQEGRNLRRLLPPFGGCRRTLMRARRPHTAYASLCTCLAREHANASAHVSIWFFGLSAGGASTSGHPGSSSVAHLSLHPHFLLTLP
jgi:hypothetical protein